MEKLLKKAQVLVDEGAIEKMFLILTKGKSYISANIEDLGRQIDEYTPKETKSSSRLPSEQDLPTPRAPNSSPEVNKLKSVFVAFSKFLKKNGYESTEKLANTSFNINVRGFVEKPELDSILKKMYPGINIDEIKTVEDLIYDTRERLFSIRKLDQLIEEGKEIKRYDTRKNLDSTILDPSNKDTKEILQEFIVYCKKSNFYGLKNR